MNRKLCSLMMVLCLFLCGCSSGAQSKTSADSSSSSKTVQSETKTAETAAGTQTEPQEPSESEDSSQTKSTADTAQNADTDSTDSQDSADSQDSQSDSSAALAHASADSSSADWMSDLSSSPLLQLDVSAIPAYSSSAYVTINNNEPFFSSSDLVSTSWTNYEDLDSLGRCTLASAILSTDLMPKAARGTIADVTPTGFVNHSYDFIDGGYIYNRCHLIGYQLTGENGNPKNLITGTRYLNIEGMLPFEDETAKYIKNTGNHVVYRITPVFTGNNLVADGVLMEAESVEDQGAGVKFNVYCYNVNPGVAIDYATGENHADGTISTDSSDSSQTDSPAQSADTAQDSSSSETSQYSYVLNKNTKKFHLPDCSSVQDIKAKNREDTNQSRDEIIAQGYAPCKRCNP